MRRILRLLVVAIILVPTTLVMTGCGAMDVTVGDYLTARGIVEGQQYNLIPLQGAGPTAVYTATVPIDKPMPTQMVFVVHDPLGNVETQVTQNLPGAKIDRASAPIGELATVKLKLTNATHVVLYSVAGHNKSSLWATSDDDPAHNEAIIRFRGNLNQLVSRYVDRVEVTLPTE